MDNKTRVKLIEYIAKRRNVTVDNLENDCPINYLSKREQRKFIDFKNCGNDQIDCCQICWSKEVGDIQ